MTPLENVFAQVVAHLESANVRWALIGGLSVGVRTEPRFTRDVDAAVAVATDAEAEQVVRGLMSCGYRAHKLIEQTATGRLATVRLSTPVAGGVILDLLFASSGIEPEVVKEADIVEVFPAIRAPVAQPGHLLALKILSRDDRTRPQDRSDILALLSIATPQTVEATREALRLISARGYHRGRDLQRALDEALEEFGLG